MPNRIIKESICTSENIDRLTEFEEITFYRLIVNVDDYGRLDARPKLIAARLFPLKDVKVNKVEDALFALAEAELIDLYKVGGKPYLQMRTWANHQTIRNKRSKYPGLDDAEHENEKEQNEDTCKQLQADASKCPRNPIQSNPVVVDAHTREDENDNDDLLTISDTMNAAFDAAEGIGLKGGKAIEKANSLAADYSAEWLLEAINRAAQAPKDAWCWRYIEGILRSWKKKGGIDSEKTEEAPKTKKQKYSYVMGGKEYTYERDVTA